MSMRFALASEVTAYRGDVIRIVEAQHRISTNRLAANGADQMLLEALADEVKPPLPEAAAHLPWLLASPFRYGYGRPSRFRAPDVRPGILYASEAVETAVTEAGYWRLVAFSRSPGFRLPRTPTPMSAFSVGVDAGRAIDLTQGRLGTDPTRWTHPSDYTQTQALAAEARLASLAAIRAPSARHAGGINVAVLDPASLVPPPMPHSSWAFLATKDGLIATREMSDEAIRLGYAAMGV
jgi:hypothetical protein